MSKAIKVETANEKSFTYEVGEAVKVADLPDWAKNASTGQKNNSYNELRSALTAKGTPGNAMLIPIAAEQGLSLSLTFDKVRNVIYNWQKVQTRVDVEVKTHKDTDTTGTIAVIFKPHVVKAK